MTVSETSYSIVFLKLSSPLKIGGGNPQPQMYGIWVESKVVVPYMFSLPAPSASHDAAYPWRCVGKAAAGIGSDRLVLCLQHVHALQHPCQPSVLQEMISTACGPPCPVAFELANK